MKRNFTLPILVILFTGLFAYSLNVHTIKASGTVYIRADGSVDPSIAPISTTDNVTYVFTGNISESVVIERDNIGVDGSGYTVQGAGSGNGITLAGRTNITISHLTIMTFDVGILLIDSSNVNLISNEITSNNQGVIVNDSLDSHISQNNVYSNNGNGIDVYESSDGSIHGNNVTANSWIGIKVEASSNNTEIVGNSVSANGQMGISVTMACFHNSLVGNDVTRNIGVGIWLQGSTGSTLSDNNVTDNGDGIYIFSSFNNILSGNMMEGNTYNFGVYGIDLPSFTEFIDTSNVVDGKPVYYLLNQSNIVISSDAYSNVGYLGLVNCANMTVQGVSPPNNVQGILLAFTSNSKIIGNDLANHGAGIYLWSSPNNTLSGNNMTNNDYGIALVSSPSNNVFHNSFTNNPTQAYAEDSSSIWNEGYPSGGNRWSDYNGTDIYSGPYQNQTGSDGIGDSGYTIDPNNIDQYPLKGTYNSFNASPEQTVQTLSNSTISSFTFNSNDTTISFDVSGQTGTAGFCRICIPTVLMNDTYRVFVNGTEVTYTTLPFSNGTHRYLYFTYTHSTEKVTIVPELPSALTLPLIMMATLLALMTYIRKRSWPLRHA
jgi:parallel beta-helix repeat protein